MSHFTLYFSFVISCSVSVCTVVPVSADGLGISRGFTTFQINKQIVPKTYRTFSIFNVVLIIGLVESMSAFFFKSRSI